MKGSEQMGNIKEEIMKELTCEDVFTFDIPGINYTVHISEAIVVTWIIMAALILISFLLTRNLKVHNISKRQAAVELIVTKLTGLVEGMVGHKGKEYVTYLTTLLLFIGFANTIGIFGFKSPTKDMTVTIALALMSIILVQIACIKTRGVKKWLKGFTNPINILDLITRPLSLCMRLFGNVLGAFVIMELLKFVVPIFLPAVFCLYFDIFDGLLQAYVFVFLTSLYISEAVE